MVDSAVQLLSQAQDPVSYFASITAQINQRPTKISETGRIGKLTTRTLYLKNLALISTVPTVRPHHNPFSAEEIPPARLHVD